MGSFFSRKKAEPAKPQVSSSTEDPAASQSESQVKDTVPPPSGPPITNDMTYIDTEEGEEMSPTTTELKVTEPNETREPNKLEGVTQKVEHQDDRKDKTIHTVTFNLNERKDVTEPIQIEDIKCDVPIPSEILAQVPKPSGDSDIEISTELPVESVQTAEVLESLKVRMSQSSPKPSHELEKVNEYHNDIETCLEHSGDEKIHTKVETHITLECPSPVVIDEPEKEVIENITKKFETKVEVVLQSSSPSQKEFPTLPQEIHNDVKNEEELVAQLSTQFSEQSISEEIEQQQNKAEASIKNILSDNSKTLITFTWEQEGSEVFLSGSFNNWDELIPMELSDNKHVANVELVKGIYYYKFFIDGNWTVNTKLPVVEIAEKGQVNEIEVKTQG